MIHVPHLAFLVLIHFKNDLCYYVHFVNDTAGVHTLHDRKFLYSA
jgi:hypothetical protein